MRFTHLTDNNKENILIIPDGFDIYLKLAGAIIRQAIEDYVIYKRCLKGKLKSGEYKSKILKDGEEAEYWLFSKGLEGFLSRTGLDMLLNVDYVKDKLKKGGKDIQDLVQLKGSQRR